MNFLANTTRSTLVIGVSAGWASDLVLDVSFLREPVHELPWLSIIGLSATTAAFVCEAILAGSTRRPVGQAEAARAIGLDGFGQN
ncbi:hypothetical protein [Streptosporangium vulgare]|uniref:hypothetical protein n=1 Tax=Streptosporangium vulgare TaxID=46190 RepID=UPI0031E3D64A